MRKEKSFKFYINLITSIMCAIIAVNIIFAPVNHAAGFSSWNGLKSLFSMGDEVLKALGAGTYNAEDQPHEMVQEIYMGPEKMMAETLVQFDLPNQVKTDYIEIFMTFKGVGALWVIAIAMMHFFQNVERGRDEWESVCQVLIEIAITGLFIMYLDKIMETIVKIGSLLATSVAAPSIAAHEKNEVDAILISLTGDKQGTSLWYMEACMTLVIPYATSKFISILGIFMAIQIQIDIAIRMLCAPLAVADIYQEGLRSPGARYLKKFFAVCLKATLAIIICAIGADLAISASIMSEQSSVATHTNMIYIISIHAAVVGAIKGLDSIANDIAGV